VATVEEATTEEPPRSLFALLRAQSHRDFSGYKERTLLRRIHRRMGLHRIEALQVCMDRLRSDAGEVEVRAGIERVLAMQKDQAGLFIRTVGLEYAHSILLTFTSFLIDVSTGKWRSSAFPGPSHRDGQKL
jgi:hypothetical protein